MLHTNELATTGTLVPITAMLLVQAGCGATEHSVTDESAGGAETSAASSGGTTVSNPDACNGCDPCLGEDVFVECDPSVFNGCVCSSTSDAAARGDYETLSNCAMESPCPPALYDVNGPFPSWSERDCLLSALRDRTVGRYEYGSHFADLGFNNRDWVLLITSQGDVLQSSVNESGAVASTTMARYHEPARRCTLAAESYFEACLAEADGCNAIAEWFTECTPSPAECPE